MHKTFFAANPKHKEVLVILKKTYPEATIALKYGNNIQLLVAVILSAQCTDKKVNEVTGDLFKKYKTANVVLGNAYGVVGGIAVDTHVKRLSQRLGFSQYDNPIKIEKDLTELFPKKRSEER